jgi:hypothetical protein
MAAVTQYIIIELLFSYFFIAVHGSIVSLHVTIIHCEGRELQEHALLAVVHGHIRMEQLYANHVSLNFLVVFTVYTAHLPCH